MCRRKKVKYDKIFKFIEPIGVLYGCVTLSPICYILVYILINDFTMPFIISIMIIVFLVFNLLGVVNYFILRFFPLKKLKPIIIKFCSYSILVTILINIILTIINLITSFLISIISFTPLSFSILYFKTLLIAKDDF